MPNPSIRMKPSITQRQTYTKAYDDVLKIMAMSSQEIREELVRLLKPHHWNHFSDENVISVLHDQTAGDIRSDLYYQLHTQRQKYNPEICSYIIEALDSHGFFPYQKELPFPFAQTKVNEALKLIQSFEPEGVALENSTQFILYQLKKKDLKTSQALLEDCSELIIKKQLTQIEKKLNINRQQLESALAEIRLCRVYPCEIEMSKTEWIRPDVYLEADENGLVISPAISELPSLSLQENQLSKKAALYLKQSNLLISMINQRNLTLLQIFQALTQIQKTHLLENTPLKPCRLEDVSLLCGVHPSTISRCCRNKYFEFNGQLLSFRTLLAGGNIQGKSHDEIHRILEMILKSEDPNNPYSDGELIELLENQKITLSRRAVAALRKKWNIPNSYQRHKVSG